MELLGPLTVMAAAPCWRASCLAAAPHDPVCEAPLLPRRSPAGHPAPLGSAAVGWRVAVYWPADRAFYPGEIVGFDEASGKHDVQYDDGEEGQANLAVDRVKWVLPPGAAGGCCQAACQRGLQGWEALQPWVGKEESCRQPWHSLVSRLDCRATCS